MLSLGFPQVSWAEEFTSAQFMKWSDSAQSAFFQNSVLMASTISARISQSHAKCLNDWYFDYSGRRFERDQVFLDTMAEHPSFHPTAVVLAVIERECGQYSQ